MKKIVNGKVYDTDMAAPVTGWTEEGLVAGVKVKVSVTLNRQHALKDGAEPEDALTMHDWGGVSVSSEQVDKAKGEFFLSFETGSWDEESKRVVPLTDDEAKRIVEARCPFDKYVDLFGDPRGIAVTPETVRKAVERQRSSDREERLQVVKQRDEERARVFELEERIRKLEDR